MKKKNFLPVKFLIRRNNSRYTPNQTSHCRKICQWKDNTYEIIYRRHVNTALLYAENVFYLITFWNRILLLKF